MDVDRTLMLSLLQQAAGLWVGKSISLAAELGLADQLADGPKSTQELASLSGAHEDSLYRLMRALASLRIFEEVSPRLFSNTVASTYLSHQHEASVASLAQLYSCPVYLQTWEHARHTITTGEPAFIKYRGKTRWQYQPENPEHANLFASAMAEWARANHIAALDGFAFPNVGCVVDVGGGKGQLLAEVLRANDSLTGILMETPYMATQARQYFDARGMHERIVVQEGDCLLRVPEGGCVYILAHLLIDWDDISAERILSNCRNAMINRGTLLILDQIMPSGNEPSFAKFLDLNIMLMSSGRVRTFEEFAKLLKNTGFRVVHSRTDITSLIEAEAGERA